MPALNVLTLEALDEAATGTLLRERLAGACEARLTTLIHRASGGNPFFCLQMFAALREEGQLEQVDDEWRLPSGAQLQLPRSVRETVARRIRGLAPGEQEALRIVAVMGRRCAYRALASMWEGDDHALSSVLDRLLETRLLQESGNGYAFPQPVLREVVLDRIPLHRRRQLHGRAGRALQVAYGAQADEHAAELAWHFLQADETALALPYVISAADRAFASYLYEDAERQYRTALALIVEAEEHAELRADLTLKLGRLLRITARRDEAVALLKNAARRFDELGDPIRQALAQETLAKTYLRAAMKDEAQAAMEQTEALEARLRDLPPQHELAMFYNDLGDYYFRTGRYTDALAARDRTMALARALDDEHALVRAEAGRVIALSALGHLGEANAAARALIPRAQAVGNREALRLCVANVAEAAMLAGNFAQSQEYRGRELSLARKLDPQVVAPFTLSNVAQLALFLGDWAAAQRHAERAYKDLLAVGSTSRAVYPLAFLGELALRRGDWPAATRRLEECIASAEQVGDAQILRYAQRLLAEQDVLAGRPTGAVARLEPLLDRPGLEELDVTPLLPTLAWARLALDNAEAAARDAGAGIERASRQGNSLARQDALRVRGMVLGRQGDHAKARALLEEAATLAHSMPYPYAEARALVELGLLDGARGDSERASLALQDALSLFTRLGATWDARQVELRLAAEVRG
jgi:adenylate cyclase